MSTKCTLASGDNFHLYEDSVERLLDDEPPRSLYLALKGVDFEASPGELTVEIPVHIWEYIRLFSTVGYDLVELSDLELVELAKARAEQYHRLCSKKSGNGLYKKDVTAIEDIVGQFKKTRAWQMEMKAGLQKFLEEHGVDDPYYKGSLS